MMATAAELEALEWWDALERLPLARGGALPAHCHATVLSVAWAALLPLFTTAEACALRSICREFRSAVAEFPWHDATTRIRGSLASWRACFPHARAANVAERQLSDADWAHLDGDGQLRELVVAGCKGVTDARLAWIGRLQGTGAHLAQQGGLLRLDARRCQHITRRGLAALPLLTWADVRGCRLEEENEAEEEEEEEEEEEAEEEEAEEEAEAEEEEAEAEEEAVAEEDAGEEAGGGEVFEEPIELDHRFVQGPLDECRYCHQPCLFFSRCSRAWPGSPRVTCKATQLPGADPNSSPTPPICCAPCLAARGCHLCSVYECEGCAADQAEEGAEGPVQVGHGLGPCSVCSRTVCTAAPQRGGCEPAPACGGECARCMRLLCPACDALQSLACAPCRQWARERDPPKRFNTTLCARCRSRGVDCALQGAGACTTTLRRQEARALELHLKEVQRAREERDGAKRARY